MFEKLLAISSIEMIKNDVFILFRFMMGLTEVSSGLDTGPLVFEGIVGTKVAIQKKMLFDEIDELFIF